MSLQHALTKVYTSLVYSRELFFTNEQTNRKKKRRREKKGKKEKKSVDYYVLQPWLGAGISSLV